MVKISQKLVWFSCGLGVFLGCFRGFVCVRGMCFGLFWRCFGGFGCVLGLLLLRGLQAVGEVEGGHVEDNGAINRPCLMILMHDWKPGSRYSNVCIGHSVKRAQKSP